MFKKGLSIILSVVLILTQLVLGSVLANTSATQWIQDFEDYSASSSSLVAYTLYTSNGTDGNAYSGAKSIYRAAASNTYGVAVFPNAAAQSLIAGKEYELRFWIKIVSPITATGTIQLMYSQAKNNAYTTAKVVGSSTPNIAILKKPNETSTNVDTTKVGEWQEIVYTFIATHSGHLALSGWGPNEYYLDDISLKELKNTTISFNSNGGSSVTAISGKSGTIIAMPEVPAKSGNSFVGWYTDSELTTPFTATTFPESDITLYAKWKQAEGREQDFENYNSAGVTISNNNLTIIDRPSTIPVRDGSSGTKLAKDVLTAAGTHHLCVFPGDSTAKFKSSTKYTISFWVYSVTKPSAIDLRGITTNNAGYEAGYPLLLRIGSSALKQGEWVQCSGSFTPTKDLYLSFAVSAWSASGHEVYIDDIVITEAKQTTISFDSNGGSEVMAIKSEIGSSIVMPAAPTKINYDFVGWYTDSELTTPFTATIFPESDITLYARWREVGVVIQDFESFDTTIANRLVKYTLYTSSVNDENVHSGTKSIYRSGANDTYRVALFPDETKKPLVAGNTYELRFWIKIASAIADTGTIQLMYSGDKNNAHAQVSGSSMPNICVIKKVGQASTNIDASKVGEWQEIVYTFTATHDAYLNLSGWGPSEYYLDDIYLKCTSISNAKISFNSNGGSEVEPIKGVAGSALPTLPVPTKAGMAFNGWYTNEALTALFTSTTFPEGEITLYAKWIEEGVYFQDFESYIISGSVATNTLSVYTKASEEDTLVHCGNKALYKPAVNSSYFVSPFPYATKKLQKGKGYKLNMWVYVPQIIEKTNEGAWQLTLLDAKDNAFSVGDRKKINIKYFNSTFKAGEWQQLELIFEASADGFMGLYAYGGFEMYVDDITLVEVETVTVSFDTCGGDAQESISGPVGAVVSNLKAPNHPDEMAFAGWFADKEYTKRVTLKTFPEANLTLYAKWIKKGSFEQTFEGYYYENDTANGTYSKDVLSLYHATSENDKFVHSGKTSMRYYQKFNLQSKTYGFSIFDPTMGQLEIGEKYYVSYWMKPKEITSTFYHAVYNNSVVDNMFANYNMKGYFTIHTDVIGKTGDVSQYFFGPAGKYSVSEPDENGWIKFTFETVATDKYFSIYLNWDAEVYIDDVVIEPLKTGVVNGDYSKPYCESLYDEISSNYPTAALTRSNEVQIYKLELTPRGDYVFSADIRPNKLGAYVALSLDGVNIMEDTKITFNSAKRLILDKSGVVYLHVYNPVGESLFGRLQLFNTRAGKNKPSVVAVLPEGGEIPELSELLKQDKYKEVLDEAVFYEYEDNEDDFESDSPDTGDNTSLAFMMILISAAAIIFVITFEKRGRKYE